MFKQSLIIIQKNTQNKKRLTFAKRRKIKRARKEKSAESSSSS